MTRRGPSVIFPAQHAVREMVTLVPIAIFDGQGCWPSGQKRLSNTANHHRATLMATQSPHRARNSQVARRHRNLKYP
jgi:hypothetical protein